MPFPGEPILPLASLCQAAALLGSRQAFSETQGQQQLPELPDDLLPLEIWLWSQLIWDKGKAPQ